VLGQWLPARVAKWIAGDESRNIADVKDSEIKQIAERVSKMNVLGDKIEYHGLASAEVVRGGVDTNEVSSKTMESKLRSGLFFVGEVLDIAGDLGGFNLHWAWASGRVAGENA
jgi:predicted flavoprotein YhiN